MADQKFTTTFENVFIEKGAEEVKRATVDLNFAYNALANTVRYSVEAKKEFNQALKEGKANAEEHSRVLSSISKAANQGERSEKAYANSLVKTSQSLKDNISNLRQRSMELLKNKGSAQNLLAVDKLTGITLKDLDNRYANVNRNIDKLTQAQSKFFEVLKTGDVEAIQKEYTELERVATNLDNSYGRMGETFNIFNHTIENIAGGTASYRKSLMDTLGVSKDFEGELEILEKQMANTEKSLRGLSTGSEEYGIAQQTLLELKVRHTKVSEDMSKALAKEAREQEKAARASERERLNLERQSKTAEASQRRETAQTATILRMMGMGSGATTAMSLFSGISAGALVAVAAVTKLATSIVDVGKKAVGEARKVQDFSVKFQGLATKDWFGGTSRATTMMTGESILKDLQLRSTTSIYTFDAMAEGVQKLISYGMDVRLVNEQLEVLGNLALGDSVKLEKLMTAYGKMFTYGTVKSREMMQMVNAGIPIFQLLADSMEKTTEEIGQMVRKGLIGFEDVNKALQKATSEGGKYYGMVKDISQMSFTGQWNVFQNNFKMMLSEFGSGLLSGLTDVLSKANDRFSKRNFVKSVKDLEEVALGEEFEKYFGYDAFMPYAHLIEPTLKYYDEKTLLSRSRKIFEGFMFYLSDLGKADSYNFGGIVEGLLKDYGGNEQKYDDLLASLMSGDTDPIAQVTLGQVDLVPIKIQKKIDEEAIKFLIALIRARKVYGEIGEKKYEHLDKRLDDSSGVVQPYDVSSEVFNKAVEDAKTVVTYNKVYLEEIASLFKEFTGKNLFDVIDIDKAFGEKTHLPKEIIAALVEAKVEGIEGITEETTLYGLSKIFEQEVGKALRKLIGEEEDLTSDQRIVRQRLEKFLVLQEDVELGAGEGEGEGEEVVEYISLLQQYIDAKEEEAKVMDELVVFYQEYRRLLDMQDKDIKGGIKNTDELLEQARAMYELTEAQKYMSSEFMVAYNYIQQNIKEDEIVKALRAYEKELYVKGEVDKAELVKIFADLAEAGLSMGDIVPNLDLVKRSLLTPIKKGTLASLLDNEETLKKLGLEIEGLSEKAKEMIRSYSLVSDDFAESVLQGASKQGIFKDSLSSTRTELDRLIASYNLFKETNDEFDETVADRIFAQQRLAYERSKDRSLTGLFEHYGTSNILKATDKFFGVAGIDFLDKTYADYRGDYLSGDRIIDGVKVKSHKIDESKMFDPEYFEGQERAYYLLVLEEKKAREAYENLQKMKELEGGGHSLLDDKLFDEWQVATDNLEKFKEELADTIELSGILGDTFANIGAMALVALGGAASDTFYELGAMLMDSERGAQGLINIFSDMGKSILNQLPAILLQGALSAFMTPGSFYLGLALLGASLGTSFLGGIMGTKETQQSEQDREMDILRNLQEQFERMVMQFEKSILYLEVARQKYIADRQIAGIEGYADGGSFISGTGLPFGVYRQPTYFTAYGKGDAFNSVLGEAGAEAILPLKRHSSGKLGVLASGGGYTEVVVNINNTSQAVVSEKNITATEEGIEIELMVEEAVVGTIANGKADSVFSSRFGLQTLGRY